MFFLLLFSSLTLPTSAFSSVHIVGSLTSKLPSNIITTVYLWRQISKMRLFWRISALDFSIFDCCSGGRYLKTSILLDVSETWDRSASRMSKKGHHDPRMMITGSTCIQQNVGVCGVLSKFQGKPPSDSKSNGLSWFIIIFPTFPY